MAQNPFGIEGALPPPLVVLNVIAGKWGAQAVFAAAELGLADRLADGPKTAAALAGATGASEDGIYRLLRALTALGIFAERSDGSFELNDAAQFLREDVPGSVAGYARFTGFDESWRAWGKLVDAVRTGDPAFDQVFGKPIFEYTAEHPQAAARLNDGMTSVSAIEMMQILEAFDFSGIEVLMDVGGGHGSLLAGVLARNRSTKGILFEMEHAMEGARKLIAERGLDGRCRAVPGDFFESIPEGADACIMKHIIHDWDDVRSLRILRNCAAALPPKGRVLIVDAVLPAAGTPHFGKLLDLEMLVLTPHGRERTGEEFGALLEKSGFRLERIVPTAGFVSIVEGVRA